MTSRNHLHSSAGFTLIEAMVAIIVFGIIFTVVGSVFSNALTLQRRALNAQVVDENLNNILESIAREVRVSQISGPDTVCPGSPANTLRIVHPTNGTITYSLSNNAIHRTVNGTDSIASSNTTQFTRLQFCITGTAAGSQPRVTILGAVQSTDSNQRIQQDFQTTLSQRLLNP